MSPNVALFIMPAFGPNEKAALLSREAAEGARRIYCTDITSCNILPLLSGDEKLGGTVIDAILKKYQELSEIAGSTHWAVLSSWLGPLVEGRVEMPFWVITSCESLSRRRWLPTGRLFNVQRRSSSSTSLASKYAFQEGKY